MNSAYRNRGVPQIAAKSPRPELHKPSGEILRPTLPRLYRTADRANFGVVTVAGPARWQGLRHLRAGYRTDDLKSRAEFVLVEIHDFHGWDASALWEDIKFDWKHCSDIERIATVGKLEMGTGDGHLLPPLHGCEDWVLS